jgi:hypothetical protein
MPTCRIDDVVGEDGLLLPSFAYMAASAANAAAEETTTFAGVFVDAVGMKASDEDWDVLHSRSVDVTEMTRYRQQVPPQYHVENGAIAVVAALLHVRDGLRLGNVRKIGTRCDYSLRDLRGNPAGVIEFAGLSGPYTSDVAAKKRKNVKRANERPARIGIVAFGGKQLRSEVVA